MTIGIEPFLPASIGITYAAGVLTTLSPCVLPLLPIVVGGAMERHRAAPLMMGLGMTTAFAMGGWLIGTLGPVLGIDPVWMHQAAAISLIIFGLALWYEPLTRMVSRMVQPLAIRADLLAEEIGQNRSPIAAFFFGGLLGLAWSPCAGPMLVSSVALVATGRDGGMGALLLGLFGLGAATPLVMAAYASRAGFKRLRNWAMGNTTRLRHGFGLLAILSGVFIATGADKLIATQLMSILPDSWMELITRF
ncbi:MAG: cytochrome c biogenesis CcdA family protein [Rhodocyclaceae bacterium]|nr:cytochrome c biogenesis CcdA family protein [Rhodocyclaceae bacterium]MDZ4215515.1 cytochrome c biogenesis CcdA family protein [Rhodocyclaceae bacterium]